MTLQRAWYSALRWYVRLGLRFYYKKIVIHGRENIPGGPVIFAANHQNAFMDALMIVCFNDHITHFLTRADIFKNPLARWVLNSLNMIPIYRMRDGLGSLSENQKTFDICSERLFVGDAVVIFPEGNHGSHRRVRSISKGFTRIAFDAIQKYPGLKVSVVPVGLNYSDPKAFRSSVSVYFGEPLAANDYCDGIDSSGANQLRFDVGAHLKVLTTHIDDMIRYDEILNELVNSGADFLNPSDTNKQIAAIIEAGKLPMNSKKASHTAWSIVQNAFSSLINFFPLILWGYLRRKIKDPVFTGSVKFGVGIFLFPAYYLLVTVIIYHVGGALASILWIVISLPSMHLRRT